MSSVSMGMLSSSAKVSSESQHASKLVDPQTGWIGRIFFRIWVPECRDRDVDVDENAKRSLKVVRFLVPQEVTDHEDSEDKDNNIEERETQVHREVESPSNEHDKRGVEKRGLNSST